jgi:hypothetical protein
MMGKTLRNYDYYRKGVKSREKGGGRPKRSDSLGKMKYDDAIPQRVYRMYARLAEEAKVVE